MLSLLSDVNVPDVPFHGYPVGIDIGLESFLATSEGQLIARPKFFNSLHRKLKLLQRRLKNKKLRSNNRRKLNIVDKNYTSQTCPECKALTGKKDLSQRMHSCLECGYTTNRDVAAAQIIRDRGITAVGQPVVENAYGLGLTGIGSNTDLVKWG